MLIGEYIFRERRKKKKVLAVCTKCGAKEERTLRKNPNVVCHLCKMKRNRLATRKRAKLVATGQIPTN